MSNTWQRSKPEKQPQRGLRAPSIPLPKPLQHPSSLRYLKWLHLLFWVSDTSLSSCISSTCDFLQSFSVYIYMLLSVHLMSKWMDFSCKSPESSVQILKPKPPICIKILSLHWSSTLITMNHEITMWHLNKTSGISNTDFCLESRCVTTS